MTNHTSRRHNPRSRLALTITLRVASVALILLILSFLTFTLLYLAPGDLVKNLLGNRPSTPEAITAIRTQYHLDDPFLLRYTNWLLHALQGDFGISIRLQQPVTEVIMSRLGITSLLIGLSFLIALTTALPLGILSAAHNGTRIDRAASASALFGLSAPSFTLAILSITLLSTLIPIFPAYGPGNGGLDLIWHLILPATVLAAGIGAILMRMTRAAMLREFESDAITFAKARGIKEHTIRQIALRNALIPIITSAGLILTFIIGGTIIVETVFALPGIGQLLEEAVLFQDLPVVQAITLLVATTIAVITIIVDLSYPLLDPRVRAKEQAS